jgi:hypothetical protein
MSHQIQASSLYNSNISCVRQHNRIVIWILHPELRESEIKWSGFKKSLKVHLVSKVTSSDRDFEYFLNVLMLNLKFIINFLPYPKLFEGFQAE